MSDEFSMEDHIFPDETADLPPADIDQPKTDDYRCQVCGTKLVYSGRGRKPKLCDEHKQTKTAGVKRATGTRNSAIASQAADILMTTNGLVAFVARMGQFDDTATAIDMANPAFREAAYDALLNDIELAKAITRGGGVTGRMALIMAYAMFGFAVVPVAYGEVKERRNARQIES